MAVETQKTTQMRITGIVYRRYLIVCGCGRNFQVPAHYRKAWCPNCKDESQTAELRQEAFDAGVMDVTPP